VYESQMPMQTTALPSVRPVRLKKHYANWPSEALKLKLQFVAVLLSQIG
jgi:hypothetical protein